MERVESTVTPMFLALDEGVMLSSPTLRMTSANATRSCLVAMTRSSVLLVLWLILYMMIIYQQIIVMWVK